MKNKIILFLTAVLAFAYNVAAQDFPTTITWNSATEKVSEGVYDITFTGNILDGWHTYGLDDKMAATELEFTPTPGISLEGAPKWELTTTTFTIVQRVKAESGDAHIQGLINWRSCIGENCRTPEDWEFDVALEDNPVAADEVEEQAEEPTPAEPVSAPKDRSGLWALILEAVLWGFAMLLTPCVFPMVPMTISFFLKGSKSVAQGRFKASMYGLFIVLLYTVPICLIIGLTWLLGGDSITADIFNWLATHWLPNLIFFAVFMVFAASFFGAFEITLPSKWTNGADRNSDKGGLLGVFFLALTLVLVSFSCTGPIVGTVLIKSTQGEFWAPMVTMLAFSVAFALPFTIFALFPSLLKKLPKSGGWLNSVKVVLGFIEIALGFKFLSTADQTYHWHLLDREVYLAIWIVCFTLLGLYLLGKIRFRNDDPVEYLSVKRLALAIAVFSFVVYLIPGMWGAPLKALSGYLPPIETQDFVIGAGSAVKTAPEAELSDLETMELPHGLTGYKTIEDALAVAKAEGRKVFVDITGHGCVNCREMEARVWSDPKVLEILRNEYVLVALYTDDKTKLPESEWVEGEGGKLLKDVGRVNSHIARTRFGVNAQPNYALLDEDGRLAVPVRGYDLDVDAFVAFLKSGLK